MAGKGRKIPQYKQLYELLRKQIVDGFYKEGDILPSENELCAVHSLTRPTVRHALDALVNEGFISKHQGKGSIVHKLPKGVGILSIAGTTSALGAGNLRSEIIVKPGFSHGMMILCSALSQMKELQDAFIWKGSGIFNEKPIFYDINYIPNINLPRFTSRNLENKSLFDILRTAISIEIKGGEQKIRAIKASGQNVGRISEY